MTAEQQHCSAGESPKLLYTTKAENCSSWMHWLNYNPHQGFQHSFPHHLNKGLLISSGNKMGKHWQKNFSLENFIYSEHVFFYCFKSSLTNAVFCPTLNTHTSQDLVGKGKKNSRIRSCQHYATAALDTALLQVYSPVWLSPKASRRRIFCPKHTEGKQKKS